jgi:rhodanese-related sulfurtransferase
MDKSWVIFLLAGVMTWLWVRSSSGISAEQVRGFLKDSPQLVDVRTPGEFQGGSAQGAVNIPLNELGNRLDELGPKDSPIGVFCRSGQRSGRAKDLLTNKGYTAVLNLGGVADVVAAMKSE